MAKKEFIKCTDIVPDKVYLIRDHNMNFEGGFAPVKILCTEEAGWLRGFVSVHTPVRMGPGTRFHAFATAINVMNGITSHVPLSRDGENSWTCQSSTYPTLYNMPQGWIEHELEKIVAYQKSLQKTFSKLSELIKSD